ncbi:MAG: hypothetical protein WC869_02170 [Phycisphaerae bacterium]|jgi:hypothetical protein
MFIGSINRYMRAVLEQAAGSWKGLTVYVACSGNFTVERILARCGVGTIHSNDVSIYSCALGWHLARVCKGVASSMVSCTIVPGGQEGNAFCTLAFLTPGGASS